jgi:glycerol-3-phosphate acyltransferase PlsY
LVGIAGLFAAMIIWRHKANIARLLKGTEPQVGKRERDKADMK